MVADVATSSPTVAAKVPNFRTSQLGGLLPWTVFANAVTPFRFCGGECAFDGIYSVCNLKVAFGLIRLSYSVHTSRIVALRLPGTAISSLERVITFVNPPRHSCDTAESAMADPVSMDFLASDVAGMDADFTGLHDVPGSSRVSCVRGSVWAWVSPPRLCPALCFWCFEQVFALCPKAFLRTRWRKC